VLERAEFDPKRTFCAQMSGDVSRLQKESMSFLGLLPSKDSRLPFLPSCSLGSPGHNRGAALQSLAGFDLHLHHR
jgi:hypothetical protein